MESDGDVSARKSAADVPRSAFGHISDIVDSSRKALDTVDPTPHLVEHGEHTWAGMRDYMDASTVAAAAPVIEQCPGVLAAADVYTAGTTFQVVRSMRLDLGYGRMFTRDRSEAIVHALIS